MPMDGLTIGAVIYELNELLIGAKVDKINQPEIDEVVINLRNNGKSFKLLLCTNASFARINISNISKQNPPVPSSFCMLLRKHLTGAKIRLFEQVLNERIVYIHFECYNDFNEIVEKKLIIEIMGKHSNLILTDENNRIYDSIRRVNSLMSRVRLVQPGLTYVYPPSQDKINPFDENNFEALSSRCINEKYMGISRQAAEEILYRHNNCTNGFKSYIDLYRKKEYFPVLLVDENKNAVDFYAVMQERFDTDYQQQCESISDAIDRYFESKDRQQRIKEKSHAIKTKLTSLLEKLQKKRAEQDEKLTQCNDAEKYRVFGELITANIYLIKKGAVSVIVKNFYDDMNEIEIPLNNTISPSANAQKYFKHYNKLKTASKLINDQITETDKEIEFISAQLDDLEKCEAEADIAEIRKILVDSGYIKQQKTKENNVSGKPMHYISSTGIDIYVGKNNAQNDFLTMRFAQSDDLWLHTKNIHGSHVIVSSASPDEKTVEEAAMLAAFYSKARMSSLVPVDATKRRFIKKPAGAPLGKVTYTNQKTYFVTPTNEEIFKIKKI